jgi:hypothetical protein
MTPASHWHADAGLAERLTAALDAWLAAMSART